jgi:hypoxanthine-DNA glycosylase
MKSESFKVFSRPDSHILILGTLPGQVSLAQQQYYAHPRNAFWPIMTALLSLPPDMPYEKRVESLMKHGIALWDVHAKANRRGSLDADIRDDEQNDFIGFFHTHKKIELICFNSNTAARIYERKILPGLPAKAQAISRILLPSTSPAYASMTLQQKTSVWVKALRPFLPHNKRR